MNAVSAELVPFGEGYIHVITLSLFRAPEQHSRVWSSAKSREPAGMTAPSPEGTADSRRA